MNLKRTIKKLTLYKDDIYTGKISIVPQKGNLLIKKKDDMIIQTDAVCWKNENNNILFCKYNYVLIRKFLEHVNIYNKLYYNVDNFEKNGLTLEDLFPLYPNIQISNYYLNYCDVSSMSKDKCLNYVKMLNKNFYK